MICSVRDISYDELVRAESDVVIGASGYEARARYFPKRLLKSGALKSSQNIVVLMPPTDQTLERTSNDTFFRTYDFEGIDSALFAKRAIANTISTRIDFSKPTTTITIDYSCMTREIYAELLYYLDNITETQKKRILVNFVYSTGKYKAHRAPKIVTDYVLLPGFEAVGSQLKKKHCIYSLGFEGILISSLHEWLEPSEQDFIVAEPGASAGSAAKCLEVNRDFVERYAGKIYRNPLDDVSGLTRLIADKGKYLSSKYDVIYVGLGPKPFVLAGLLAGLNNRNVANVYAKGTETQKLNVEPLGKLVVTQVRLDFEF